MQKKKKIGAFGLNEQRAFILHLSCFSSSSLRLYKPSRIAASTQISLLFKDSPVHPVRSSGYKISHKNMSQHTKWNESFVSERP